MGVLIRGLKMCRLLLALLLSGMSFSTVRASVVEVPLNGSFDIGGDFSATPSISISFFYSGGPMLAENQVAIIDTDIVPTGVFGGAEVCSASTGPFCAKMALPSPQGPLTIFNDTSVTTKTFAELITTSPTVTVSDPSALYELFADIPDGFAITNIIDFAAPVPEPSTWAMMLMGFAGIGFASYRKSRRESFTGSSPLILLHF
jgi:PEP-CTERM motif